MIIPKYRELLDSLRNATENGLFTWKPTSLGTKYELKLDNFRISVYRSDPDSLETILSFDPVAEINFIDESGNIFESIIAQNRTTDEYKAIDGLFQAIRRQILDIDNKINQIQGIINNVSSGFKSKR